MFVALLFLASTVQLVDERVEVPAHEWRYIDFVLNQQTARVRCSFETVPRGTKIKAALVRAADLQELREGALLGAAVESAAGTFEAHTRETGQYAIVLDNRGSGRPVQILLRIDLDFGVPAAARYADPRRQLAAILLSFAVFFAVVTYSARRLLSGSRGR
jgi:hypothetical protein